MKIIHKYVLREHLGPLLFAASALTSLMLLNYIAKQLANLVGKGLAWQVIAEFFVLSLPFTVAMTLPMAVLVAVLHAFSRLAAENEITAMKANGISMRRIMLPVLGWSVVFSIGMIAFNDRLLPLTNHRLRTLQGDIARKKPSFALREQIINEVSPGQFFLRTTHLDPATNKMRDITIYDLSDQLRRHTIYADSGQMALAENGSDLKLTLYNGFIQEVPKEEPEKMQRLYYVVDQVRVKGVANAFERDSSDTYKSDREMTVCELQDEVTKYERDFRRSRERYDRAADAAKKDPSGMVEVMMSVPPTGPAAVTRPGQRRSLGRLYCDATRGAVPWVQRRLGQVALALAPRAAYAAQGAEVPQAVVPPSTPSDTVRADTSTLRPVAPSTGVAPQVPAAVEMEAARAEMMRWRSQVNQFAVEIHKKFAISCACVVFVLLGAPLALRFPRGGVGLVLGISLVVFALYYVGLIAGESLADRLIMGPAASMWSANALFTAAGLVLVARMERDGGTTRGSDPTEWWGALRRLGRRLAFRRGGA